MKTLLIGATTPGQNGHGSNDNKLGDFTFSKAPDIFLRLVRSSRDEIMFSGMYGRA